MTFLTTTENARKADTFRNLEEKYRAKADELRNTGHFTAANQFAKEADACLEMYLRYMRRSREQYTFTERLLSALGFTI